MLFVILSIGETGNYIKLIANPTRALRRNLLATAVKMVVSD